MPAPRPGHIESRRRTCQLAPAQRLQRSPRGVRCARQGNVDNFAYTFTPDPQVPLTHRGHRQAQAAGYKIKAALEVRGGPDPTKGAGVP